MNPVPGTVFIPPGTISPFLNLVSTKKMHVSFLWDVLIRSHISTVYNKLPQILSTLFYDQDYMYYKQ